MNTGDDDYSYPEEGTFHEEWQSDQHLDPDWAEADDWFRTVRTEMQAGHNDSDALNKATEHIFARFSPILYNSALSKLQEYTCSFPMDRSIYAEEIAYDALGNFLSVKLPGTKFIYEDPRSAVSYMCKSARSSARDLLRRYTKYPQLDIDDLKQRRFQIPDEAAGAQLNDIVSDKPPIVDMIKEAGLTEREKKVIRMLFFEEKKVHEIADLIGETPHRVSCIRHRALQKLKKVIRKDDEDEWRITLAGS